MEKAYGYIRSKLTEVQRTWCRFWKQNHGVSWVLISDGYEIVAAFFNKYAHLDIQFK
jgi:hypothetical protein